MAQPTASDVHYNTPLTNVLIAYQQAADAYVATRVFSRIPVLKQSDIYYEFQRDAFFRNDVKERAPGTESAGTGFTLIPSGPYFCKPYAVHYDLPDPVRQNADSVLDLEFSGTELVAQQQLINQDMKWLAAYMNAATWSTNLSGVQASPVAGTSFLRWDQAGSDPQQDIRTVALIIKSLTGFRPNVLVLGPYVTNALINNPELKDAVKYTSGGIISPEDYVLLAKFFGVQEVISAEAVANTAPEGSPLQMGFMAGKHALLAYRPPNPGLMVPAAGYTFAWTGYPIGQKGTDAAVKKFRMEHLEVERIEASATYDMRVIGADLGAFFQNCVS